MDETFIETTIDDVEIFKLKKNNCSWSKCGNFLVISTTNQDGRDKLYFFNLENQIFDTENSNDNNIKILAFKWNNCFPILACIWQNQDIEIFIVKDDLKKVITYNFKQNEDKKLENNEIINFYWFNEGSSFFFVTNNGLIKFYDLDSLEMKLNLNKTLYLNDSIIKTKKAYLDQNLFFYFLNKIGTIYCIDEKEKSIKKVLETNLNIIKFLFFKRKTLIILITKDLDLYQYSFLNNNFVKIKKTKLEIFGNLFSKSSKVKLDLEQKIDQKNFVIKLDDNQGLIGLSVVGERIIRIIQIDSGHNEAMINIDSIDNQWSGLNFLKFNKKQKILIISTSDNQLIIYKIDFNKVLFDKNVKDFDLTKLFQINFQKSINKICISSKEKISVISNNLNINIIEKQSLNFCLMKNLIVKQIDSKELECIWIDENEKLRIIFEENIRNINIDSSLTILSVQSNKTKEFILIKLKNRKEYEILNKKFLGNYKIILHEKNLWYINMEMYKDEAISNLSLNNYNYEKNNEEKIFPINLKNLVNKSKLSLKFVDLNNNFLLIVFKTDTFKLNYIYTVYELNDDQAVIKFIPTLINFDEIILNSKINSNSSLMALHSSNNLFFIELGKDNIEKVKFNFTLINNLFFDYNESRLICIEDRNYYFVLICYKQKLKNQKKRKTINYFIYEKKKLEKNNLVIGFQVPDIYILKKDEKEITKNTLIEFNEISFDIVKILIDFLTDINPNLSLMIKSISKKNEKNENLWLNLARISVKCSNIEMGLFCMSKLKNIRIIQDVQNELKTKNFVDNEIDKKYTALAVLAFNLSLFEEAEKFFLLANNNAKLIKFYESFNDWDKAIFNTDNLSKRTTYYNYAKYFEEELNDFENAIKYYELSNTSNFEIPRLLFDTNKIDLLKNYCLEEKSSKKENSVVLKQWWGHYCESIGDFDSSIEAYRLANDYYNQVRLLCSIGKLEEAKKVLELDKNLEKKIYFNDEEDNTEIRSKKSALLHIAKQIESIDPNFAVQCFLNCGAINYAIKICKINKMKKKLIMIIQNFGSENEVIEILNSIEENEENYQTLFNLYKKINMYDNSIKMGLKGHLWQQLRSLLKILLEDENELKTENDSTKKHVLIEDETIELALEILKNNSDIIDIVFNILLIKGNNENLIKDLILDYKIQVNEELIKKIESIFGNKKNQSVNSEMLFKFLAESALMQGKYNIAAKIFNFNNDRLNAIKALVRSNDINKVINYANVARNKEVFKIAANFLQKSEGNEKTVELFLKKSGQRKDLERFSQS